RLAARWAFRNRSRCNHCGGRLAEGAALDRLGFEFGPRLLAAEAPEEAADVVVFPCDEELRGDANAAVRPANDADEEHDEEVADCNATDEEHGEDRQHHDE